MTKEIYTIEDIRNRLVPIFSKYGLLKAAIFGSYAKKQAKEDSDVDLLVTIDESFDIEKYLKFETAVKRALKKRIDILEFRCISQVIRDEILKEAVTLYEYQG